MADACCSIYGRDDHGRIVLQEEERASRILLPNGWISPHGRYGATPRPHSVRTNLLSDEEPR